MPFAVGPVSYSAVALQKYGYDIFGPGVNLAARIEAVCEPMDILVESTTYNAIQNEFRMSDYGERDIRGFGPQRLYRLDANFTPANDGPSF